MSIITQVTSPENDEDGPSKPGLSLLAIYLDLVHHGLVSRDVVHTALARVLYSETISNSPPRKQQAGVVKTETGVMGIFFEWIHAGQFAGQNMFGHILESVTYSSLVQQ